MKIRQLGLGIVALAGLALSFNSFGAVCNLSSTYTSTMTTCFKGSENNDKPDYVNLDKPFGATWTQLDKTDKDKDDDSSLGSLFTLTASNGSNEGSWTISNSSGNSSSIWDVYGSVMVSFKSGNKFGNYEAILVTPNLVTGDFTIGQNLSHATLWGTGTPSPVPLPAAAWLFGSALLGLAGAGYRRKLAKTV